MSKPIDMSGQMYGRLIVITRSENAKDGKAMWLCKCECGGMITVRRCDLVSGKTKSCGCLHKEISRINGYSNKKHGLTNTRLWRIWCGMKSRCNAKSNKAFKHYGGRGISICGKWANDFTAFYTWAINNGYGDNLTIDRIDNDGNYEPCNCRWATYKEQENNRRNTTMLEIGGVKKPISEWSDESGIQVATLVWRLKAAWPLKELFIPASFNNSNIRGKTSI